MKKIKLLAVIMSVVMVMSVLALLPSAAASDYQMWSVDMGTFGTKVTDGPFTFGYVAGDNGMGAISGSKFTPATLNANGTQLDSAEGVKLFFKVNSDACMSIKPGANGYTTVILFTAPVAGTYTYNAEWHKWNSGATYECGIAIPQKSTYKTTGVANAAGVENTVIRNGSVTLAAGEVIGFCVRGWGDDAITLHGFSVILGDDTVTTVDKSNFTSTDDAISFFTAAEGAFTFPNNGDASFVCDYNKDTVEAEMVASRGASAISISAAEGLGKTATSVNLFVKSDKLYLENSRGWTLIKYTAPVCGTYNFAFVGAIVNSDGSDTIKEYQSNNNFFFVGNDTDGYDVVRGANGNPSRVDVYNHDPRTISTTQTVEAGDTIMLAVWTGRDMAIDITGITVTLTALGHEGEVEYEETDNGHRQVYTCCGAEAEAPEAHDFSNGNCVCGKAAPSVTPDPDPTPSAPTTADTAISIATAIAVAGIIGFALVTKKR